MGSGDPVVLFIHGLFVDNLSSWYLTVAPALSPHARLVMYDLRGHGLSERPASGYTLEDQVLDAEAILGELELADRPVTLVGNSFGGRIALAFGVKFPERVSSIVIVDSHPSDTDFTGAMAETRALSDEAREERLRELWEEWLERQRFEQGDADVDAIDMKKLVTSFLSRKRRHMARAMWELAYETSFISDVRASKPPSDAELAKLPMPVLALYGENSHLRDTGERLRETIPDCTFRLVPDCAHFVVRHRPELLREELLDWIVGARTSA